jgi:hypothetical protein
MDPRAYTLFLIKKNLEPNEEKSLNWDEIKEEIDAAIKDELKA